MRPSKWFGFLRMRIFPIGRVVALRAGGADVMTALEAGLANQGIAYRIVLAKAGELGRCLITHNRRDFLRLHRERQGRHTGMVLCTHHSDVGQMAEAILNLTIGRDMSGEVERVNRGG